MAGKSWLNFTSFMLLLIVVYLGVAVFAMHQRGLLTRETFDLLVTELPGFEGAVPVADKESGSPVSIRAEEQKPRAESDEIERRVERLEMQRKELERERVRIEEHLKTIKAATAPLAETEAKPSEEMVKLVRMYEGMQPEEAAAVLENLPDSTVARIVLNMRRRQAGQIMASLSPDKAAEISKLLVPDKIEEH